jgi:hypothetical protein
MPVSITATRVPLPWAVEYAEVISVGDVAAPMP